MDELIFSYNCRRVKILFLLTALYNGQASPSCYSEGRQYYKIKAVLQSNNRIFYTVSRRSLFQIDFHHFTKISFFMMFHSLLLQTH